MALRPYQQLLKQNIYDAWQSSRNILAVLPTGGGKSVVKASIIDDLNDAACCIAHRRELVSQISLALAREGVRHRIIAPDPVIKFCARLQVDEVGRSLVYPNAQVAVAGVDTLIRPNHALDQWGKRVALWVQDECFIAGTLVDGVAIEDLHVGHIVTAFDEGSGRFEPRRVARLFKNPAPSQMVRIETEGHHVLHCTSGHPFWTREGWKDAERITEQDELLVLPSVNRPVDLDGACPVSVPEERKSVLQQDLRISISAAAARPGKGRKGVRGVRLRASAYRLEVLQSRLLRRQEGEEQFRDDGAHQPSVRIGADAQQQSNEGRRYAVEGVGEVEAARPRSQAKGRKRATGYRRRTEAARDAVGARISAPNYRSNRLLRQRYTHALQNRLRQCGFENSDRSGRRQSRCRSAGSSRPQERRIPYWARVASATVLKSADIGGAFDGFVYNIEVEGLHTYVANDVTVHNCHHLLRENKWGQAIERFPNAKGLGVTATPGRADGKGLGRHAHGLMDVMVEGPGMRQLIADGYLTDYRIIAPTAHLEGLQVGTSGDYTPGSTDEAIRKSKLIGDIVPTWLRFAAGKKTVVFAHNLEAAGEIADEFIAGGYRAAVASAKTPDAERVGIIRRFREGALDVLVNVDLFGEGFDLPAIECVIMARPTASLGLYMQQFGRVLRILDGKLYGLVIDHVGNVLRHGLPDRYRAWTLDAREKRTRETPDDVIPTRTCLNPTCAQVFERLHPACPYCGHKPEPAARSGPEHVDGDLFELDAETLARMRGDADRINLTSEQIAAEMRNKYAPIVAQHTAVKRHKRWQLSQAALRDAIEQWSGYRKAEGLDDRAILRLFYFRFGLDVLTAHGLRGVSEVEALTARVVDNFRRTV